MRPHRVLPLALLLAGSVGLPPVRTASAQGRPAPAAGAPGASPARDLARAWRRAHEREVLDELSALLAMPNVARDTAAIRRNARALVAMLEKRGVAARILEHPASAPAVYGELRVPGATRTVVLYAHYDGQPVDTARWRSDPWRPVLRDGPVERGGKEIPFTPGAANGEWRLYARSASDDKGPIVAMLAALDALRASRVQPTVNVKFFFEGAEEAGSPGLPALLQAHRALLGADLWLFADGPVHQSRRPQVTLGVRGAMGLVLTVYGPARALHSGHYGNWVPNPAARLAELLASMRTGEGEITIAGFADDVRPLTAAEREALRRVPEPDAAFRRSIAIARTEGDTVPLAERIMRPALNVRSIVAGSPDAPDANAIPTEARASMDFRLVPGQTPEGVRRAVERHLTARGWTVVRKAPTLEERARTPNLVFARWGDDGYAGVRTPVDHPAAQAVTSLVTAVHGAPVVVHPMLGGSLPLAHFTDATGAPLVVLPVVNHDNNQHTHDENLRLQNLWDGIETFAAVMRELDRHWKVTP